MVVCGVGYTYSHDQDSLTKNVQHQPVEVMQHAWELFQQTYGQHGAVSGCKSKALALVSLLYSSRLLHGAHKANEEYLLKQLATSTRVMNRAFTQMASAAIAIANRSSTTSPTPGKAQ